MNVRGHFVDGFGLDIKSLEFLSFGQILTCCVVKRKAIFLDWMFFIYFY